jgi:hypothetical protein
MRPKGFGRLGDVIVQVLSVRIGNVALKVSTGEGESTEPLLAMNLEISNTNPNRKIDYVTWAGQDFSLNRDFGTLTDNNANSYKRIGFGIFNRPVGRADSNSIYPGKPLTDVLIFEAPLKTTDFLSIELCASNVGEKGLFRIRIPASMIER